jgi:hypothetical protein
MLILFVLVWMAQIGAAQSPGSTSEDARVAAQRQFYTQVRPLLATYCWSCHSATKQEGGLRLDSREGFQAGGFSKKNLLETDFEKNELLRRLQALDPHERMPLGRAALAEEDRRVLETWLKAGAVWSDMPPPAPAPGKAVPAAPKPWADRFWEALDAAMDYDTRYLYPVFYAAIACFFVILGLEWVYERAKRQGIVAAEMRGIAGLAAHLRPYAYLVPVLGLVIAGLIIHHQRTVAEAQQLQREVLTLRTQAGPVAPAAASPSPAAMAEAARPLFLKTKAPFKFGGTYYRGNDERNDQLYNGGYYRTATLKLALCNAQREEIKLGDELPEEGLMIRVIIIRGRNAVPTLFSRQLMSRTILTLTPPSSGSGNGTLPAENFLEEVRTGEEWHGYLPLRTTGAKSQAGDAYLVTGNFDGMQRFSGNAHFLIHYDLKRQEHRLAPDSELWLAATLFPGNMVWPQKYQIAASEWFDFLPIPEIEGPNTTDPALLGVPEHEKRLGEKLGASPGTTTPAENSSPSDSRSVKSPFAP